MTNLVTKHHLLFYCSGHQKPQVTWWRWIPSENSRGESISLSFPHSRNPLHSLASGPSLHFQSQQPSIFKSLFLWFWFSGLPLSFIKMFVSRLGQTGSFNITSPPQHPNLPLQSLFCYRKSHTLRFQGWECEHHWGTIIQPTTPSKMEMSVYVQIFKKYFISKIS